MTILAAAANLLSDTSGVPNDQRSWIIYGAAVAAAIYLFLRPMFRRRKPRGALAEDGGRPFGGKPPGSLSRERAVEREMNHLLVQLADMARQITAQLDTRAAKLELLIRDADRTIDRLEALVRPREQAQAAAGDAPPERPIGTTPDGAETPAAAGAAASHVPDPSAEAARHADIYGLADEGRTAQEIAQVLSRPRGEVELILALRR